MSNEPDNHARWDGRRRGHYEVWYLTLNDPKSGDGYWIRYTLESPLDGHGEPYAQLWFARFSPADPARTFGINRKLPIASFASAKSPFSVTLGANRLAHDQARGALSGDGHAVEWDLTWKPTGRTLHQLPKVMYRRGGLGETTVLSPNVDIALNGSITVDGQRFELCDAPGGQTHLWGKKHAHAWAWGHCNAFDDHPGTALEVLTVNLVRRGIKLPQMTVCTLRLDGEDLAFNHFHQALWTKDATTGTGLFRFTAQSVLDKVEGEFTCRADDLVRANYHDPDGDPSYCHNSCAADLRLTVLRRSGLGWKERLRLVAPKRGHFEVAGRARDPAVTRVHVEV